MASSIRLVVATAVCALAGCPHPRSAVHPTTFGPDSDAPWALEDEDDWSERRDQLFGLALDDPQREPLRVELAAAQAARIDHWLDADRPAIAYDALLDLVGLWGDDPAQLGADLAPEKTTLERARKVFAKSGADQEVVLALAVLAEVEPDQRDARWAEIDEVFDYADQLSESENGAAAVRARPIEILEPVAMVWPLPKVTDRFVELVAARQAAVSDALAKDAASFELVRAHASVLKAARQLAAALSRAGREDEIVAHISPMQGIGADEDLVALARKLSTAKDVARFAQAFRSSDENDDPATARQIARWGLGRFADDATLTAAQAAASTDLGRVHEPIRLYEALVARGAADAEVAEQLAGLYQQRLAALALSDRPVSARKDLAALETFDRSAAKKYPNRDWDVRLAGAMSTMGRGLVTQGELDEAEELLEKSVDLQPDTDAYQTLATVAIKQEKWKDAEKWAERGADAAGAKSVDRAKLLKIAGDAAAGTGDTDRARDRWLAALSIWAELGDTSQLGSEIAGLRLVQGGELMWSLGEKDEALKLLDASVDIDPDGADTYTEVIAFFIVNDDYTRALDAFHRAVIADKISDYYKVYMSLWMMAESHKRGVAVDPLALEYLQQRSGTLWYDDMARLATGRVQVAALARRANTRARKAELDYYTAVLGLGDDTQSLFRSVVSTDMVLFFEYDMARHQLAAK